MRLVTRQGFTIVELVVVLLLVGVLSAVAIPRFIQPSAFDASVGAQFVLEEARFAQKLANYRQDQTVSLVISRTADELLARVVGNGGLELRSNTIPLRSLELRFGGNALAAGQTLTISYGGDGRLRQAQWAGTTLVTSMGIDLEVVAAQSRSLCIYPSGFADHVPCV